MADASSEFNTMSLQFERTTKRLNDLQASAVQLGVMLASLNAAKAGMGGDEKKSAAGSGSDGGSNGGGSNGGGSNGGGSNSSGSNGGGGAWEQLKSCKEKLDELVQLAQTRADFDAKIALIGQYLPGFNEEMRQQLATLDRSLASDKNIVASGGDRNAILKAQQEAVQSHSLEGANADTLAAYTRNIGLYAATTGTTFENAAAVVRDLHNTLGITSEAEFTRFGDRLTAVGSALGVRVSEIGGALATSGAWADKSGVSKEDSAALMATLLKGGMDQGEASSSFASMMKSFSTASKLSAGDAKRLGFGSGGALYAAMQKDMVGTLTGLLDKLGDMDLAAQMTLATQLFGANGQKIVRTLKTQGHGGQTTSFADQLREARLKTHSEIDTDGKEMSPVAASDTMAAKAAAINGTAKVHFGQMYSEFERFSLLVSESLLPVTKVVVDNVTLLVRGLNTFLEVHPAFTKGIGSVAATFMAVKAAALGFKGALSGIKSLVPNVKMLFGGGSVGRSSNIALASSAMMAAEAIRKLTLRIAELGATASLADSVGADINFEPSDKQGGRSSASKDKRSGRNRDSRGSNSKRDERGRGSNSKRSERGRGSKGSSVVRPSGKGNRLVRKAKVMMRRLSRTKFGRFFKRLGGSRIGKMVLAGLESELSGDGLLHSVMSKGSSLFQGGRGVMSKAAKIFRGGGGLVSKVMRSGVLKGASKMASKLFKPLGLVLDGWNLAEGLASGDSHQIGKAGGSALGGLGGGWAGAALGASIGSVVPGVGTAIGGAVGGILGSLGGSAVGDWLGDKAAGLYDWFTGGSKDKKDGQQNGGWLSKAATIVSKTSPLTMLLPSMDTVKSMGSTLSSMGGSVWQFMREKGSSLLNSVTGAASGLLNALPCKAIGGKIAELGASAWQTIRGLGSHLFSAAKELLNAVPFKAIGKAIGGTLAELGSSAWQTIRDQSSHLFSAAKGLLNAVPFKAIVKAIGGTLAELGSSAWQIIRDQGAHLFSAAKGLLNAVPLKAIGKAIGGTFAELGASAWQTLAGMGRRVWQSVLKQGVTLVGSLAERGRELWANLREQGEKMLASLKKLALWLLPDISTPKRFWDFFFGDHDSGLKTKSMAASRTLPASRLCDPTSRANTVINSTSTTNTTVTQNVSVTLHANGNAAQNQQLIDQLLKRLRSELAVGHPIASSQLNRRLNAGLTDAANG